MTRRSDMNVRHGQSDDSDDLDYYKSVEALSKFLCPQGSSEEKAANGSRTVTEFLELLNAESRISYDSIGIGCKCVEICEEEKAKLKEKFKEYDGQISISIDVLRSGKRFNSGSEYLCLKAHFINDSWCLQKLTLGFTLIGSEGGGTPHEIIIKSLKDWDIEGKVHSITMIDCDYYDHTLKVLKDHIQGMRSLPLNGRLFKLRCSADIVNQMVQSAYGRISSIFDKIRTTYNFKQHLPRTWKLRSNLLKNSFKLLAIYTPQELREKGLPEQSEWKKVSDITDLVDDIYDAVYMPFELEFAPASVFLPHLQELHIFLKKRRTNANAFIRRIVEILLIQFEKYMNEMYLVFAIATVLDPRFKTKYIKFSLAKIKGEYADLQFKKVLKAVRNLYDDYTVRFPVKENPGGNSTHLSAKLPRNGETPACEDLTAELEGLHISDIHEVGADLLNAYNMSILCTTQPAKSELDLYLEEPVIPWFPRFDPLGWWKASSLRFPTLSRMARDFLAIPGSVATGHAATHMKQRKASYCITSSTPEFMNAFVCFREWFLKH